MECIYNLGTKVVSELVQIQITTQGYYKYGSAVTIKDRLHQQHQVHKCTSTHSHKLNRLYVSKYFIILENRKEKKG